MDTYIARRDVAGSLRTLLGVGCIWKQHASPCSEQVWHRRQIPSNERLDVTVLTRTHFDPTTPTCVQVTLFART